MKHGLRLLLCLAACFFSTSVVLAQEQPQDTASFARPIQEFPFSQTVYLQERHEIQLTLQYFHNKVTGQPDNNLSLEVEFGITDWLQVSSEYDHHYYHRSQRRSYTINQLEAATMASILNTSRQALSFWFGVEFPVTTPQIETEEMEGTEVSLRPMLLYGRQLGSTQLHLNGGTEVEAGQYEWFYNAAALYGGSGKWHPLLELNGTYQDKEADWYLAPGLVLGSDKGWELAVGARRSLLHAEWGFSAKLLYEFIAGKH